MSELIERVLSRGDVFSSRLRIIDTNGVVHRVLVVGDRFLDDDGNLLGTTGFYIDVTETFEADVQQSVTEAVAEVDRRRGVIHEAMGIIRMTYGVTSEQAFDVLKWRSQETNVKLRTIADQFVRTLVERPLALGIRTDVDHVLLTAHERTQGR